MNRKFGVIALSAFALAGLTFLGSILSGSHHSANASNRDIYEQLNLFGDVFKRVRAEYVEKPDEEKLIDAALSGMLTSLDPHSSYMNADSFKEMQVQTQGEFGGLGIQVTMDKGLVKVISPIDDTPAHKAGILSGDLISHLDGEAILGLTLSDAVKKMRGKPNTPITLTILREGKKKPLKITIKRAIIEVKTVRQSVEKGEIGYIRITNFSQKTQIGIDNAFKKFNKEIGKNVKGYILDLRNNPGGLLDQAISVSDSFLERGEIVSTRGRNASETKRHRARRGDLASGKPIVVLINGGSASASEIVAGALQDHQRATIMGTRSFGKGSVQTIFPIGRFNGKHGAIRLTTARYYTPNGNSIQAKGITPDVIVKQKVPEDKKEASKTKGEAGLRGHLKNDKDKEEASGSSAYVPEKKEDDVQLQRAINRLLGVTPANKTALTAPEKPKLR